MHTPGSNSIRAAIVSAWYMTIAVGSVPKTHEPHGRTTRRFSSGQNPVRRRWRATAATHVLQANVATIDRVDSLPWVVVCHFTIVRWFPMLAIGKQTAAVGPAAGREQYD